MVLSAIAGFIGCEWESTGYENSYNSRIGVNVSGAYRDAAGSYLVQVSGPSASQQGTASLGTGDGVSASFSGDVSDDPIARGTVTVTDGTETFTDVDGDGTFTSTHTGFGTVNYSSGAVAVTFETAPAVGVTVSVTFRFYGPGTTENPQSGTSGEPIFLFTVRQNGNRMEITDDHGDTYVGRIEDPFTEFDSGDPSDDEAQSTTASTEDTGDDSGGAAVSQEVGLSYPFEVSGSSGGNPVTITGTIKAEVTTFFSPVSDTSQGVSSTTTSTSLEEVFQRTSFRMLATWLETANGGSAAIDAIGPSDEGASVVNDVGAIN